MSSHQHDHDETISAARSVYQRVLEMMLADIRRQLQHIDSAEPKYEETRRWLSSMRSYLMHAEGYLLAGTHAIPTRLASAHRDDMADRIIHILEQYRGGSDVVTTDCGST